MLFESTVKDWYLARIYSNIEKVGGGSQAIRTKYRYMIMKPVYFLIGLFSSVVVFSLLANAISFIGKISSFLSVIIFLGIIYGFYWLKRDYEKYKEKIKNIVNHPKDEKVVLYGVSNDGVLINFYNLEEHHFFIRFNDIKDVRVVKMELEPIYKDNVIQLEEMEKYLKTEFSKVKKMVPDFDYEEKIKHDDKFSVRIETKQQEVVYLPLPPSWKQIKLDDIFVETLQNREIRDDLKNK